MTDVVTKASAEESEEKQRTMVNNVKSIVCIFGKFNVNLRCDCEARICQIDEYHHSSRFIWQFKVDKTACSSQKFWKLFFSSCILQSLTENSPTGIESEYDTASTNSRSDNEHEEYEDDDDDDADEEDSVIDEEGTGEDIRWPNLSELKF